MAFIFLGKRRAYRVIDHLWKKTDRYDSFARQALPLTVPRMAMMLNYQRSQHIAWGEAASAASPIYDQGALGCQVQ